MNDAELVWVLVADLVPLVATLFSFLYGVRHFFKKGKPLFLQTITMAMGSHALGSVYHLCHSLTSDVLMEGFTPAYLGRIGFFLFILTASYGQMDRIVDDGSPKMRPSRYLALLAPVAALLLYLPNGFAQNVPLPTKIVYGLVWLPAFPAVYFNLKHAVIPNADFGFVKALKPYNACALCLGFSELICLTAWDYYRPVELVISCGVFAALCICTMLAARKGADQWTI